MCNSEAANWLMVEHMLFLVKYCHAVRESVMSCVLQVDEATIMEEKSENQEKDVDSNGMWNVNTQML